MTRALAIILLMSTTCSAGAQPFCRDGAYPQTVRARACDPVTHRCVKAWRRFCPVWR